MKSREITAVAIRIVIIYLLWCTIASFPIWLAAAFRFIEWKAIAFTVTGICLAIAIGLIVILWRLSKKLISESSNSSENDMDLKLTPVSLEKIILRCIGLFLMVTNLGTVVSSTIEICKYRQGYDMTFVYIKLIESLALLSFGSFLIAKPRHWLYAIRKIRRI